ncbi:hypothetical protein CEUSTIGMA_g747.t1 [Chlamydomonas eustigma]|uniref:Thioredoxin domain-containing protein n=1 Tax=Chlamydomonas eustigma TaxID=1157962 RepID=A0A250WR53_9CHLO|nr:hypothetical protein CEUSTIGMA_g747.t1 [Chlamydomonas eustigma]|eukprot:GAX73293.1 hypothetical protein CEUSTIGMA_g747.t1 [Chlamydomonas eustigma]
MQSTFLSRKNQLTVQRQNLVKSCTLLRHDTRSLKVYSSDAAIAAPFVSESGVGLYELTKDNFWSYMEASENKDTLIVVDCYTDWCGPCKMIYPDLVKLTAELEPRARIVKFNCNKYNKELGVQLNIKVAPTFLMYRNKEKVGEMTGAKLEKLKNLITEKLDPPAPSPVA